MPRDSHDQTPQASPDRCPACRSRSVVTTSKIVTAHAYWRCHDCGEVWNDARRRAGTAYADRYSTFRR